jgi:bifunctional N-acetylglucosamine-1-phosphate-uridyltransferase/glucosamine-1-phosphate-acetyltransferase GlmU-like protein
VILPCAGAGTRLGLPYPKEVHFVLPGTALIDLTVERFTSLSKPCYLIVVIKPGKELVPQYLAGRWADTPVRVVHQQKEGFLGAIEAALPECAAANLILLPDQVIKEQGALEAAFKALEAGAKAALLALETKDMELIGQDGALRVENGRLAAMAEKPGPIAAKDFNAVWCGLGFRKETAEATLKAMKDIYYGKDGPTKEQHSLDGAPVFAVDDYADLGVWDRMIAFQKEHLT